MSASEQSKVVELDSVQLAQFIAFQEDQAKALSLIENSNNNIREDTTNVENRAVAVVVNVDNENIKSHAQLLQQQMLQQELERELEREEQQRLQREYQRDLMREQQRERPREQQRYNYFYNSSANRESRPWSISSCEQDCNMCLRQNPWLRCTVQIICLIGVLPTCCWCGTTLNSDLDTWRCCCLEVS